MFRLLLSMFLIWPVVALQAQDTLVVDQDAGVIVVQRPSVKATIDATMLPVREPFKWKKRGIWGSREDRARKAYEAWLHDQVPAAPIIDTAAHDSTYYAATHKTKKQAIKKHPPGTNDDLIGLLQKNIHINFAWGDSLRFDSVQVLASVDEYGQPNYTIVPSAKPDSFHLAFEREVLKQISTVQLWIPAQQQSNRNRDKIFTVPSTTRITVYVFAIPQETLARKKRSR